jgi:hypothetical protein
MNNADPTESAIPCQLASTKLNNFQIFTTGSLSLEE